jgi:hypothetical protein
MKLFEKEVTLLLLSFDLVDHDDDIISKQQLKKLRIVFFFICYTTMLFVWSLLCDLWVLLIQLKFVICMSVRAIYLKSLYLLPFELIYS